AQLSLERDYETQREYDTRFRVLMESTSEAIVFVSVATGEITEANSAAVALIDRPLENLIGNQLSGCFEGRKRGDMVDALASQAISGVKKTILADLRGNGSSVQIFPTLFRAAGERILLCRLVPEGEGSALADDLNHNL
ncbi:transcriptional regulator PpsR, partial [Halomonas litopenaei]|nr:transcriptional regulator PpsR [Halomonas litopenaei]